MGFRYRKKIKHFRSWKNTYHFIKWRIFRPQKWRFETLYNKINKKYLKSDLSKDYFNKADAKEILEEPNYHNFREFDRLRAVGAIKDITEDSVKAGYYSTEDIKDELLRRECTCWKDYALYRKELYARPRHKRLKSKSLKVVKQKVVLVFDDKEYTLGKFNKKLIPKLKRIIKEIYAHKDLFDPNNPNYISPNNLTYIGEKIKESNIDTIDPIQVLLDSPLKW